MGKLKEFLKKRRENFIEGEAPEAGEGVPDDAVPGGKDVENAQEKNKEAEQNAEAAAEGVRQAGDKATDAEYGKLVILTPALPLILGNTIYACAVTNEPIFT